MPDRLLPTSAVLDRICISKTELYRRINSGEFPRPVPVGRQRVAFLETEVSDWIAARVKARDQDHGAEQRRVRASKAISAKV
ncbi:MAG: helix-turn-helix transcriptional regulator [Hyphomicrobium sp.]